MVFAVLSLPARIRVTLAYAVLAIVTVTDLRSAVVNPSSGGRANLQTR